MCLLLILYCDRMPKDCKDNGLLFFFFSYDGLGLEQKNHRSYMDCGVCLMFNVLVLYEGDFQFICPMWSMRNNLYNAVYMDGPLSTHPGMCKEYWVI